MALTPGAVACLLRGDKPGPFTMQVQGIKKMTANKDGVEGPAKFKLLLSDGESSVGCVLASQISHLCTSGAIIEHSIIEVHEAINNAQNGKHIVIVLNVAVIQREAQLIGNPQLTTVQPAPPQQQQQQQGPPPQQPMYGAPPPQGNYGPPPQGNYGPPQPQQQANGGGYGAPAAMQQQPQQQGMYGPPGGAPPPGNPYGAGGGPPGGYGAPPPANQPPVGAGYGAPPPAAYGAPPQQNGGGYGAPPPQHQQNGGYGAPPPQHNAYGAPPGQFQQQNGGGAPPAQYHAAAGGVIARNDAPVAFTPIHALNSYQNRWTIKARVTGKSEVRRYNNARGEGKFFSFDLLDAEGGEIRVMGWNAQCDQFFDSVDVGQVVTLSRAALKAKRGNFNQTRHQLEIHLDHNSQLEVVPDEAGIPRITFNFAPLAALEATPAGAVVDVIGVVEGDTGVAELMSRDGRALIKRGLTLRDQSGRSIELTLWGATATGGAGATVAAALAAGQRPVLAAKGVRVGDFNGKTLSTLGSSVIMVDPGDVPEAEAVRAWYDAGGGAAAAQPLSSRGGGGGGRADRRVALSTIEEEGMGREGDAPSWVQTVAQVAYARNETFCYPACPGTREGRACNKKMVVQDEQAGAWHCEACNHHGAPDYRYILSLQLEDHTGQHWVTAFDETARGLLGGIPAGELKELGDANDPRFGAAFKEATLEPHVFKLKVSNDTYNEEAKVRYNVTRTEPLDFVAESRWALAAMERMDAGQPVYPKTDGPAAPGGGGGGGGYGGGPGGGPGGGGYGAPGGGGQFQPQQQGGPQNYAAGVGYQQQQGQWGAQQGGGYGGPPQQQGGWQNGGYGGGGGGGGYNAPPQQNNYQQPPQHQQQQQGWAPQGGGAPAQDGGYQKFL